MEFGVKKLQTDRQTDGRTAEFHAGKSLVHLWNEHLWQVENHFEQTA
jgi:hypothetical protein